MLTFHCSIRLTFGSRIRIENELHNLAQLFLLWANNKSNNNNNRNNMNSISKNLDIWQRRRCIYRPLSVCLTVCLPASRLSLLLAPNKSVDLQIALTVGTDVHHRRRPHIKCLMLVNTLAQFKFHAFFINAPKRVTISERKTERIKGEKERAEVWFRERGEQPFDAPYEHWV